MPTAIALQPLTPSSKPHWLRYISTKSNEINAIKEILKALDLRDTVITIDAIGTQTEIAKAVRLKKKRHYILQVKDNQKLTKEEVQSFCPLYDAHIVHQEQRLYHGRIETRTMSKEEYEPPNR